MLLSGAHTRDTLLAAAPAGLKRLQVDLVAPPETPAAGRAIAPAHAPQRVVVHVHSSVPFPVSSTALLPISGEKFCFSVIPQAGRAQLQNKICGDERASMGNDLTDFIQGFLPW